MGELIIEFTLSERSLKIFNNEKIEYNLPYLWIRDNCPCNECRIKETQEKRFILSSVPPDLKPHEVNIIHGIINVSWPDKHKTVIQLKDIDLLRTPRKPKRILWTNNFTPEYFDWDGFLNNDEIAINAISEFISKGAICIKNSPTLSNSLEMLSARLGPIREVLFERIHNVSIDTHVYNIAHTSLEVPPHNDFASYSWPPSVQALHMLANECEGGESMIVDGYSVLNDLQNDNPNLFKILCSFPVPFREFDEENETYTKEPIVRLNSQNKITGFRFSNQLMQMIDPIEDTLDLFYMAYHELCNRINSEKYKSKFRLESGHILLVHGHRVLHGRCEFQPDGKRHLQDAYYEMDNVENNLVLYKNRRGD